jgi:hypothetical protein
MITSIVEKNQERREGRKLKEEAKLSTGRFPQDCEDQLYYFVSFKLWFHNVW